MPDHFLRFSRGARGEHGEEQQEMEIFDRMKTGGRYKKITQGVNHFLSASLLSSILYPVQFPFWDKKLTSISSASPRLRVKVPFFS